MSFSFIKLLKHFSNTNMPPLLHLVKTILMNKKLCCWSAVVSIAISCTIFELFDVEHVRNLEIWVSGHSRSLKLVPFKSLGTVSYSPSIVTMAVSIAILEIFSFKNGLTMKNWGPSRSLKMAPFDRPCMTFY